MNNESFIDDRSRGYQIPLAATNDPRRFCLEWIKPCGTPRVLDVGCACGDFAAALKKECAALIWGMEYNPRSLAVAKRTAAFEEVFQIDLNALNVETYSVFKGFFDYIVLGDVLEHLLEPQRVLAKLKTFLKERGRFLISLPNVAHASVKANLLMDVFEYTPVGLLDETHLRFFTYKTIPDFLAHEGLVIEDVKVTGLPYRGMQTRNVYAELPRAVKKQILSDRYSYVCQFVLNVRADCVKSREELCAVNRNKLVLDDTTLSDTLKALRVTALRDELFYWARLRKIRYFVLSKILTGAKRERYRRKWEKA